MKRIHALEAALTANPQDEAALVGAFLQANDLPLRTGRQAIFFFYDGRPVEQVFLIHWVHGLESRQPLQRLAGSQAWALSLDLPPAARVEYKFELRRDGRTEWVRDPNNPRQAFDPFGSNSVCPMPEYKEPTWVHRDPLARRGRLQRFLLRSQVYGDERPITVYLPHEYRAHKRYPLLICQDGSDYRRFASMVEILDNLVHRHEVKPLIVAFTDGVARNEEYGANPRQPAFLVDELLPALRERHEISEAPEELGLMGASFGGVASLFTAWTRPGVFGRLLLQSGSFVFTDIGHHGRGTLWDPVVRFVNAFREDPARVQARIYMSCGRFEGLIAYNRGLVPLLRKAGLDLRFQESDDGHNWICWRDRLREGLCWLFPGYLWMTYD